MLIQAITSGNQFNSQNVGVPISGLVIRAIGLTAAVAAAPFTDPSVVVGSGFFRNTVVNVSYSDPSGSKQLCKSANLHQLAIFGGATTFSGAGTTIDTIVYIPLALGGLPVNNGDRKLSINITGMATGNYELYGVEEQSPISAIFEYASYNYTGASNSYGFEADDIAYNLQFLQTAIIQDANGSVTRAPFEIPFDSAPLEEVPVVVSGAASGQLRSVLCIDNIGYRNIVGGRGEVTLNYTSQPFTSAILTARKVTIFE